MTLAQVIAAIEGVAAQQPLVGTIVRQDIFIAKSCPVLTYGLFAWTQGVHSGSLPTGWTSWRFYLHYADRLTKGHGNEVEVQSVACEVLRNVLQELRAGDVLRVTSYTLNPYTESLQDECAGAYADVTIQAPDSDCFDDFLAYRRTVGPRPLQLLDGTGIRDIMSNEI